MDNVHLVSTLDSFEVEQPVDLGFENQPAGVGVAFLEKDNSAVVIPSGYVTGRHVSVSYRPGASAHVEIDRPTLNRILAGKAKV